ncbi:MAG: hypothetical protein WBM13_13065 [Bacteroidia bacterium]
MKSKPVFYYAVKDGVSLFYAYPVELDKAFDIIGNDTEVRLTRLIGFRPNLPSTCPFGKPLYMDASGTSPELSAFTDFEPLGEFRKFLDKEVVEVDEWDLEVQAGDTFISFQNCFRGELRIDIPASLDYQTIIYGYLERLGHEKLFQTLCNYPGSMIYVNNDGSLHSIVPLDFKIYWEEWDCFKRFNR